MTRAFPLQFFAGRRVREHVAREGFRLEDFPTLLGAAGGPKWLVLYGLDRVLAPKLVASGQRFDLIGASIGSWRFAAYAQRDPAAALDRLLANYTLEQTFSGAPLDMDAVFRGYCDTLLGETGAEEVLTSDHAALHVIVAWFRRGWVPSLAGIGLAAGYNAIGRKALLRFGPERLVLSSAARLPATDWPGRAVPLTHANLGDALRASGAVPGMVRPVRDLVPGEQGYGVDGGIIDYHFDANSARSGFVLYPHFYPHMVPGWFDKPFRGRRVDPASVENLLVVSPSPEFVARLPGGKVPDRNDPRRLGLPACRAAWLDVAHASRELGDAFEEALAGGRLTELVAGQDRGS